MNEATIAIMIVVVFFCVFPLFWCGIVYMISRLGGWSSLARHYAFQGPFAGTMFSMQSVKIGSMGSYGNCVTFGVNDDGLYLRPMFLFRPGHRPLMIPWDDIEARETRVFFVFEMVTLSLRMAPGTTITISKRLAMKLCNASGRESLQND